MLETMGNEVTTDGPVDKRTATYGVIDNKEWDKRVKNANPHLPDRVRQQMGIDYVEQYPTVIPHKKTREGIVFEDGTFMSWKDILDEDSTDWMLWPHVDNLWCNDDVFIVYRTYCTGIS